MTSNACVTKAIKNDLAIYAAHTNMDSVFGGVNSKICEKLELQNCRILSPIPNYLKKLVTFVPLDDAQKVREALFEAGAGNIGNYDSCSFNVAGIGSFKGNDQTNPYVGERNQLHQEEEIRIETIFPKHIQSQIIQALLNAHPYEEVAFDIYSLDNEYQQCGIGMIGDLKLPMGEMDFLLNLKKNIWMSGHKTHSIVWKTNPKGSCLRRFRKHVSQQSNSSESRHFHIRRL